MSLQRPHPILSFLFALVVTPALAAPPAKLALTGGRIVPVVGADIPSGTVLIENGRITAIGEKVDVPFDATVVDVSGKVLMPGMIDPHDWRGLDVPNENLPVAPFLDVYDAIDPSRLFFEDALRDGITSVHIIQGDNLVIGAVSRVVRPIGLTPDEMTLRAPVALKMSTTPRARFDRMMQLAMLRETFGELHDYLGKVAEHRYEESLQKEGKQIDVGPAEARKRGMDLIRATDLDDKHRNLWELIHGRLDAWIYCGAATDVAPAIAIARDNGFLDHTVFVLGPETYRAVDELVAVGRPVVLPADLVYRERDPLTGKLSEIFIPKVFADAKIRFALQPDPDSSLPERYLEYQASRLVRHGIPRRAALAAITIEPARMLGLGDQIGSLETGKLANIVVLSGDPLDFDSWVEKVYIDGILAYDRQHDPRLQQLLQGAGAENQGKLMAPQRAKKGEEKPGAKKKDGASQGAKNSGESGKDRRP